MSQKEKDFIDVCHMLSQLAILKQTKPEEQVIALMAKYLLSELDKQDISQACSHLAKRKERFPDVADFFNLVVPMPSIEETAEREIGGLMGMIKDGWDNSKDKLTEIQKDLLSVWPWHDLAKGTESGLQKTRINMTFFLRNKLGSDGKVKILMSNKAFLNYQHELKQLQGEQNGQIEINPSH
jgi:hypothetical protein